MMPLTMIEVSSCQDRSLKASPIQKAWEKLKLLSKIQVVLGSVKKSEGLVLSNQQGKRSEDALP